jgi:HYR domain/Kelch motif
VSRAVLGGAVAALVLALPASAAVGFTPTGSMASVRQGHTATLLPNGKVLVAGFDPFAPLGPTAELYDPVTGSFGAAPGMSGFRRWHTASLLGTGDVLIAGGGVVQASATADLYDPDTSSFSATGTMTTSRRFAGASVLEDERVLVSGGQEFGFFPFSAIASAELYDYPLSGTFTATDAMDGARASHTSTTLPDGRVLVVGGYDVTNLGLQTAEIYDPATGVFSPTGGLSAGRGDHTATLLPDGKVLIAGGFEGFPGLGIATTEIYDPQTGVFAPGPAMAGARGSQTASSLPDGRVLVAGGFTIYPFQGVTLASAEIFDPDANAFVAAPALNEARGRHAAAALANGDILVTGGLSAVQGVVLASAEVFSAGDSVAPAITVPDDIEVDATQPAGAVVSYSVTAVDDVDGAVPVVCSPASGSTFAIGATTVSCNATDAAGNTVTASFTVRVKGAVEQVADVLELVDSYNLAKLGTSLQDKLVEVQEALSADMPSRACDKLAAFVGQVKAQSGKG